MDADATEAIRFKSQHLRLFEEFSVYLIVLLEVYVAMLDCSMVVLQRRASACINTRWCLIQK